MKKSIKLLMGIAGLGLIATALAGCGGGGEASDDGTTKIIFGHCAGDSIEEGLKHYAAKFAQLVKQNEGVDVVVEPLYVGGYNDVSSKVKTWYSTGDNPTTVVAYPDAVSSLLAYNDIGPKNVVNFDKYLNDPALTFGTDRYLGDVDDIEDFIPSFIEEGQKFTIDGTYTMPFMKSTEIMLYNLDAVTRVMNIVNPSIVQEGKVEETIANFTWDELIEFAKVAIKNKDQVSSSLKYAIAYDSDSNMFISHMIQKDVSYSYVKEGKGAIGFNDNGKNYEAALGMLDEYKEWHDGGILTTKGCEGTYTSDSFKKEEVLFCIGSSGGSGYSFPEKGTFSAGMCKVPARNNKEIYVSQGPTIAFLRNAFMSDAQNDRILKYAWKFYKYITSPDVNVDLCINYSQGYTPVRESCYSTEGYLDAMDKPDDYAKAAKVVTQDIDGRYFSTAVFPGSAELRTQVGSAVAEYLKGKTATAKAALDSAINAAATFIK